jgi:SAM-dependent methyltransferase
MALRASHELKSFAVSEYSERLRALESVWWKKLLDVQRPYRWHVRGLDLGFVLDVGCGIGRNLTHLKGNGVGVDLDPSSVQACRERGLTAFTAEDFSKSPFAVAGRFDALLCAHVLEHMVRQDAVNLLKANLPYVKKAGKLVLITPQEAGFASDHTHVSFCGTDELRGIAQEAGIEPMRTYSFPLPRAAGRFFKYNEFVFVGKVV